MFSPSHGSFATATCIECGHQVPGEDIFADIKAGRLPYCPQCSMPGVKVRKRKYVRDGAKKKAGRRNYHGEYSDEDYDSKDNDNERFGNGIMKPDITFFGEPLPKAFAHRLVNIDQYKADLLLVIGTSLKVKPVSELPTFLPRNIPQICISRTPVNHHAFDIDLLGDCDVVVAELAKRAGWAMPHDMIPADQEITIETVPGHVSRHVFTSFSASAAAEAEAAAKAKIENGDHILGSRSGNSVFGPDGDDVDGFATRSVPVITTTRSGRRSGRVSPK